MAVKGEKEINIIEGKNVQLIGFEELDDSEVKIANQLIGSNIVKLSNRTDYQLLRFKLKIHQKAKTFIHELEAELFIHPGKSLGATTTHKNLYLAISLVMKKLLSELDHLKKRDIRNRPVRKKII